MADSLAGVVLAAGAGTRLRPLTLAPAEGAVPGRQRAAGRPRDRRASTASTDGVAVNVHHGRTARGHHLRDRVHLSVEEDRSLGTAGALGHLRPWIDGRPVLRGQRRRVASRRLRPFVDGWDGERIRLLLVRRSGPARTGDLARGRADALVGRWRRSRRSRRGCTRCRWRTPSRARVPLDPAVARRCVRRLRRRPREYLAANLLASSGCIGAGSERAPRSARRVIERSVVWPGATVAPWRGTASTPSAPMTLTGARSR